ncbi:YheC/YheD family protein [Microscilla marina]|uniref:ATP-grasp domain-containing protein n=1 Tax=Microscilla marina ATCC 23134 TaxID=313606 RepID=A1ZD85_MICM2|nr:YheC/YheD family protein [Microscilla marina]EAY31624.1 hypothetical protein M23134_05130 [Microscilla marina ATCC 23134]
METIGVIARRLEDKPPFGKQTYFFEDMPLGDRSLPPVFFFSPLDWSPHQATIPGYTYAPAQGKWQPCVHPLPRYIYDRFWARTPQDLARVRALKAQVMAAGGNIQNPQALSDFARDKYQVFEFLKQQQLPTIDTLQLAPNQEEALAAFLDKYPMKKVFYIKANTGGQGRDIYILHRAAPGFSIEWGNKGHVFTQVSELHAFLVQHLAHQTFIVQPRAHTARVNGGSFDVRVLIQNYGNAQYHLGGMGVRVGARGGFMSNLSLGATAMSFDDLVRYFQRVYAQDLAHLREKMTELCLHAAHLLHQQYGDFVELGFDLLLTQDQQIQLLEINARPARWLFTMIANASDHHPAQQAEFRRIRRASTGKFMHFFKQQ